MAEDKEGQWAEKTTKEEQGKRKEETYHALLKLTNDKDAYMNWTQNEEFFSLNDYQ